MECEKNGFIKNSSYCNYCIWLRSSEIFVRFPNTSRPDYKKVYSMMARVLWGGRMMPGKIKISLSPASLETETEWMKEFHKLFYIEQIPPFSNHSFQNHFRWNFSRWGSRGEHRQSRDWANKQQWTSQIRSNQVSQYIKNNPNHFKSILQKSEETYHSISPINVPIKLSSTPLITFTLRSASGQGERPRRQPRVPDAPKSEHDITWKSIRIKSAEMKKIQKHKIEENLENNAETWYNFGTNKPVLVRQRYAVVL